MTEEWETAVPFGENGGVPLATPWGGLHLLVMNWRSLRDLIVKTTIEGETVHIVVSPKVRDRSNG
jgi:hypothetical protein